MDLKILILVFLLKLATSRYIGLLVQCSFTFAYAALGVVLSPSMSGYSRFDSQSFPRFLLPTSRTALLLFACGDPHEFDFLGPDF